MAASRSAAIAPASPSAASTRARSASRSANGPTPQNRSATVFASADMIADKPRQHRLAFGRRLQEGARRQHDLRLADAHRRSDALHDQLAVAGQPREPVRLGEARERARALRRQRAGTAHVHVEPGIGRGGLNVERLLQRAQRLGERPRGRQRAGKRWRQHRAFVDRDDVVRPIRREADFEHAALAAPRMKRGAAPPVAMRVDQFADRRVEARLPQRRDDQLVLPCAIARKIPVLRLAAAAHAEMRTERRDALRACGLDAQQMAAVRVTGRRLDLHHLARQRIGHEHRSLRRLGDAVAAMAEARDGQPFGHAAALIGGR